MAGHWYARACGLPAVLSSGQALSCYRTIFRYNVVQFAQDGAGSMGAVNGMRPPKQFLAAGVYRPLPMVCPL
jgi:non-lysosomal glucosylceramidase